LSAARVPASPLARNQWIAVGEVAGHASGARILSAAAIDEAAVLQLFADRIEVRHDGEFDAATGAVMATRSRRLGAIRLASGPDPSPDQAAIAQALLEGVREHGLQILPWDERALQLRYRTTFASRFDASIPALDEEMLSDRIEEWLSPLLIGKRRLGDMPEYALSGALEQLLGYDGMRALDRLAPPQFTSPAGSQHAIDYSPDAGPTVEVRAQALFGLGSHPAVAGGRVPLILAITWFATLRMRATGLKSAADDAALLLERLRSTLSTPRVSASTASARATCSSSRPRRSAPHAPWP